MAQDLSFKKQNFMSRCVDRTKDLLDAYAALRQLRQEWTSEGFASSISQGDITGTGIIHLTPAVLANLMNTFDKIDQLIATTGGSLVPDAGYLTNLYHVKG